MYVSKISLGPLNEWLQLESAQFKMAATNNQE